MIRSFFLCTLFSIVACSTTKQIKTGATAYQQKQYAVAIPMLLDEIVGESSGPSYADKSYMLGISYKNLNDSDNALKWFIESAKNDYGLDAYWEMAYMLKKKERYEDAILSFQRLRNMTSREDLIALEIEKCKEAIKLNSLSTPSALAIEPLALNTEASDYAPQLYQNQLIVFTSDRTLSPEAPIYNWTGNAFSDLYAADLAGQNVRLFDEQLVTEHNEGTATFTKEGNEMYFTFCHSRIGDSYCQIMRRDLIDGLWSEPSPAFNMKSRVNYGDPVLIEDDQVLIFVSNDPTGIGGHDLYYSLREEKGWSDPELMPTYLNTTGQERFPTWDGKSLYYSSDNFSGLGGLDIFKTTLNEDGSWTRPENMLKPFNSSEDDYSLIYLPQELLPSNLKQAGFFTSTRGIYGSDDIYSFGEYIPDSLINKESVRIDTVITAIASEKRNYYLMIRAVEKTFANPNNPNSFVVGNRPIADVSLKLSGSLGDQIIQTDSKGLYVMPIDSLENGTIVAGKQGYLNQRINIDINTIVDDQPDRYVYEYELILDKIYEGVDIVLDNIFYDFNESFIREDAKPALDYLTKILSENPKVSIELSSHTDCRGEEAYNLKLSEDRAAAAINYIISSNPALRDRLTSRGYGESAPEISCECNSCSEDEHQINRRTTFKIMQ